MRSGRAVATFAHAAQGVTMGKGGQADDLQAPAAAAAAHLPVNTGLRFSMKAVRPSV